MTNTCTYIAIVNVDVDDSYIAITITLTSIVDVDVPALLEDSTGPLFSSIWLRFFKLLK
jgi:hypothetical protein